MRNIFNVIGNIIFWLIVIATCLYFLPWALAILPVAIPIVIFIAIAVPVLWLIGQMIPVQLPADYVPPEEKAKAEALYGNAHFRDLREGIAGGFLPHSLDYEKEGIVLGLYDYGAFYGTPNKNFVRARYSGEEHILTFAGARSGKGVNSIIPTLLDFKGPVVCIDPKGQNAAVTARARRELGQKVYLLNPFNELNLGTHAYNPFEELRKSKDVYSFATDIAEALISIAGAKDMHWPEKAREFLTLYVLYVALHEQPDRRDFLRLRDILSFDETTMEKFFEHIRKSDKMHPSIKRLLGRMSRTPDRETGSVFSTISKNLNFLELEGIADYMKKPSDFSLSDFKKGKGTTIYIIVPDRQMHKMSGWMRLQLSLLSVFLKENRIETKNSPDVLFLIDEAAVVGPMLEIKKNMGIAAGLGIKYWLIYQSLAQLTTDYDKETADIFFSGACVQSFGIGDETTAKKCCFLGGKRGVAVKKQASHAPHGLMFVHKDDPRLREPEIRYDYIQKDLISPSEAKQFENDTILFFPRGGFPLKLKRMMYFKEPYFKKMCDPDPYH